MEQADATVMGLGEGSNKENSEHLEIKDYKRLTCVLEGT